MKTKASVWLGMVAMALAPGLAHAAGGGAVAVQVAPIVLDGALDASYQLIVEDTFAAPDVGQTGQTASSDLIGESAANLVWFGFGDANYLGYDDGAGLFNRGSGSADIKNLHVTWDDAYVYLAVEGPNAFHEGVGAGDDMDLFIAIDTASSQMTATTPTLASSAVPGNKAIDFAGWSPNYFVAVRAIGSTAHDAALYQGTTVVATDADFAGSSSTFEVVGAHAAAVTEIRIAWSLLGGAPAHDTGVPWNMAVYTTYSGDQYDAYDSAPGLGQGSSFEQLGDSACDSDHCGGALDPVTGAGDACDCVNENDGTVGAGLSPNGTESPGSDNTAVVAGGVKDVDTIQSYFLVSNVGELPDADGDGTWDGDDGCPDDGDKTEPGVCGCGVPEASCNGQGGGGGAGGAGGSGAGGSSAVGSATSTASASTAVTSGAGGAGGVASGSGGALVDGNAIEETGSCGCRTPGGSNDTPRWMWLVGALGAAALRRRRRG